MTPGEPSLMCPPEERIDRTSFVDAMRQLASGVVMVTVSVGGRPWGLTISSCSSLSTDPPQILISVGSQTVTCREIKSGGHFGVSVLGADHREIATLGAATGVAKFVDEYCNACETDGTATPRVRDALYHLDCRLVAAHEYADHTIIIGGVARATAGPGADPLVYFDRAFRRIGDSLA